MKISTDQREVTLSRDEVKLAIASFVRARWPRAGTGGQIVDYQPGPRPDLSLIEHWEFRVPNAGLNADEAIIARLP